MLLQYPPEITKISFVDAGPKFKGMAYIGTVNVKFWLVGMDPKVDPPEIDVNVQALCKKGLRSSVAGTGDTLVDGPPLTDDEYYKKWTDQLEPKIKALAAEYETGQTKEQREAVVLADTKVDTALTTLEGKING